MRAAISHRHTETLGGSDDDIGSHLAGRLKQSEAEQVGGNHHGDLMLMRSGNQVGMIFDSPLRVGILQQHAKELRIGQVNLTMIADDHLDPLGLGPAFHHIDRLRVALFGDEEMPRLLLP